MATRKSPKVTPLQPRGTKIRAVPAIYRLTNTVQHYDWGSYTDIRGLLGTPDSGQPEAELWLGAHPSAPSLAQPWDDASAEQVPLDQLIHHSPVEMLGNRILDTFGPRLPYLMKVLAADRALSLQVHPAAHHARAGFNRENREQVPVTAPNRNFRDANHKPEMIVAITEFHALAGLRAPRVVLRMLEGLSGRLFDLIRDAISQNPGPVGLKIALSELLSQRGDPNLASDLIEAISAIRSRMQTATQYQIADQTAVDLAEQFPDDVGALSSYLLNRVNLLPGEALFLEDGEVHAYLKGLGVEVMASSDNVLRAGLTSKHIDVPALLECMSFRPRMPYRPEQIEVGEISRSFTYRPPAEEFALTIFDLNQDSPLPVRHEGPRTILVLEGTAMLAFGNEEIVLNRGVSVFVPAEIGAAQLSGYGQAACAWVP